MLFRVGFMHHIRTRSPPKEECFGIPHVYLQPLSNSSLAEVILEVIFVPYLPPTAGSSWLTAIRPVPCRRPLATSWEQLVLSATSRPRPCWKRCEKKTP